MFTKSLFLLLSISFSIFHGTLAQSSPTPNEDLVEKTCKYTPSYDLCVSTIRADPRGASAQGPSALAMIVNDAALAKGNETLNFIVDLQKQKPDPPSIKPLQNCLGLVNEVVAFYIPEITIFLHNNTPKYAVFTASKATDNVNTCQLGFQDPSKSPIADRTQINQTLRTKGLAILIAFLTLSVTKTVVFIM
ncbi:Pectinesterase inhibitor domain [Dillenia turbinata]|uniref:Pectinesterase inhibitor domain n=1 Tax=Dillenia turbinata TaxID=194707 RepID=A0AAN8VBE5_9MAGN